MGRQTFLPQINAELCIGCELCVRYCPGHALGMEQQVAVVANGDACDYAGVCQEICPTGAISLVFEIVIRRKGCCP